MTPSPTHGHRIGDGLQFEELVGGDDAVAKRLPCSRDDGSRTGRDDDFSGPDALPVFHFQHIGFDEAGITFDEHTLGHLVGAVGDHALDEHIAQVLHVFHCFAEVQAQAFVTLQAEALEHATAMKVLGDLNHGLGGHAADTGAGRPQLAAVDQNDGFSRWPDPAHGVQTGAARADDCDIYLAFFHFEPRKNEKSGRYSNRSWAERSLRSGAVIDGAPLQFLGSWSGHDALLPRYRPVRHDRRQPVHGTGVPVDGIRRRARVVLVARSHQQTEKGICGLWQKQGAAQQADAAISKRTGGRD